jgi:hypothetical protein
MSPTESYGVSAEAYLDRAGSKLRERTNEGLFYAAFELRCFVEARQDEYLDAQRKYAKSIPAGHQIGKQGKVLDAIFHSDLIQHIQWLMKGEDAVMFEAFHVPVTSQLRNGAERLGDLLHHQRKWRASDDAWWAQTRKLLVDLYRLAWTCRQGLLVSPVFLEGDGSMLGTVVMKLDGADAARFAEQTRAGAIGRMRVDYLSTPPAGWIPDLID